MDTPPTPSASAVLDAAAQAAAAAPAPPRARIVQFPLPDLLAAIVAYAQPPLRHLSDELKKAGEAATAAGGDPKVATRDVLHFEVMRAWCRENPDAAARVVIAAAYLAEGSGKFVVQEERGAEEAPAAAEDPAPAPPDDDDGN